MTNLRKYLSWILIGAIVASVILMIALIIHGFPVQWGPLKLKNLKKIVWLQTFLALALIAIYPARAALYDKWKKVWIPFFSSQKGIVILFSVYSLLFVWRQVTEYFALQINFIPFMYYPAMLDHFMAEGIFNFTGELHGFYHLNNLLYLLTPLWKIYSDPFLFVLLLGPILASAIFPLRSALVERMGKQSALPWFMCFIYLNYTYLERLEFINFGIESLYPVLLLTLFYFGNKPRPLFYYFFLFLILLVKEDSFIYVGTVGLYLLFVRGYRWRGILTGVLSLAYVLALFKWFVPWTGSMIFEGNMNNFAAQGETPIEVVQHLIFDPSSIMRILFGSPDKIETYLKLSGALLFIPLWTPAFLMVIPAILPPFMHMLGRDQDFFDLRFHYAAPVIPFVFMAFVIGLPKFLSFAEKHAGKWSRYVRFVLVVALILANGGKYRSAHFTSENLESIAWARSIPPGKNLVTHGHLLPHVGQRPYNYYLAEPWLRAQHPLRRTFLNADYYLLDYSIDLYPWDANRLREFQAALEKNGTHRLSRSDGVRFIYERPT